MFFLVYVSSALKPFSKEDLVTLLEKSRKNNSSLGVSGMLLYKDGNFLQVLEGEEEHVKTLYAKIAKDPRHKGVLTILQGPSTDRDFPDWSMGFRDLASPEVSEIPGFSHFLDTPLTRAGFSSQPSRAKKMLLLFKKNM